MDLRDEDLPGFEAVGRVARALTYPALSSEYDLTLRELYAIATLPQAFTVLDTVVLNHEQN